MILNTIVEIIPNQENRWVYSEEKKAFIVINQKTRIQGERAFEGFYGWVDGYGTPPENHMDVIVLTREILDYGDSYEVKLVGAFKRSDGDHKLICIDKYREENDFYDLSSSDQDEVFRIYNENQEGDQWLGYSDAKSILDNFDPNCKVRT